MIALETLENIKCHNKKAYAVDEVYVVVDLVLSKKRNDSMRNLIHLLAFIHSIYNAYSQTLVEEDKLNIWERNFSKLDLSLEDQPYSMQMNLDFDKLEYTYFMYKMSMICLKFLEYWWLLVLWIFILLSYFICDMLQIYFFTKEWIDYKYHRMPWNMGSWK